MRMQVSAKLRRKINALFRRDDVNGLEAVLAKVLIEDPRANSGACLTRAFKTIAHEAARLNAVGCLRYLVEWDLREGCAGFVEVDERGYGLIHHAAEGNAPDAIKWIIDNGYGSIADEIFQTGMPFKIALDTGSFAACVALLERGAPRIHEYARQPDHPAGYDMRNVIVEADEALFAAYFDSQPLLDAGLALAARLQLPDAETRLLGMGARRDISLDPHALKHFPTEVLEPLVEAYARQASDVRRTDRLPSTESFENLLKASPSELLVAATRGGYDPVRLLWITKQNRDVTGNRNAVVDTLRAMTYADIKRSMGTRILASCCPMAIDHLASIGFPPNERFPLRGMGAAAPAELKSRIVCLLESYPVRDGWGDHWVPHDDPWPQIAHILKRLPEEERKATANRVLWGHAVTLPAAGFETLFKAGAHPDSVPAGETESAFQRVLDAAFLGSKHTLPALDFHLNQAPNVHLRDAKGRRALAQFLQRYGETEQHWEEPVFASTVEAFFALGATMADAQADGVNVMHALFRPRLSVTTGPSELDCNKVELPAGLKVLLTRALEEGLDLNSRDDEGRTPLMICVQANPRLPIPWVLSLVDLGLDFEAIDIHGKSAGDYVATAHFDEEGVQAHWVELARAVHAHKALSQVRTRRRTAPSTGL